jgi:hypothetical protein
MIGRRPPLSLAIIQTDLTESLHQDAVVQRVHRGHGHLRGTQLDEDRWRVGVALLSH